MADTLVARVTGQASADDTGFEVGIVMPIGSLIDPDDPTRPRSPGWGPSPPVWPGS